MGTCLLKIEGLNHSSFHFATTHMRQPFQLHINYNDLSLGVVFIQLDDDGYKFVVAYPNWSNNKMKAKFNSSKEECFVVV